jgi:UPF0271 protein
VKNTINLNADLGEGMGQDESILKVVCTANIACGGHVGDALSMRQAILSALENNVEIGAHPSFPDKVNFGRKVLNWSKESVHEFMLSQISTLSDITEAEGGKLVHVKPHGALNNMSCVDRALAEVVASAVLYASKDAPLILLAPCLSELYFAGKRFGIPVVTEAFADRRYKENGQLVPRLETGAVIHGVDESISHVRKMLEQGGIVTTTGSCLPCNIQSLCLHGDNPISLATAEKILNLLEYLNINVSKLKDFSDQDSETMH